MQKEKYYSATFATAHFHCPHCNVYAEQKWSHLKAVGDAYTTYIQRYPHNISNIHELPLITLQLGSKWCLSKCEHCHQPAIWFEGKMLYPKAILVNQPNEDLSEEIKKDYLEAATIFNDSPRAAAALLRLALQKLCIQLGEKGENINHDIGEMVKKGLNPLVQKSLDALRITGNNAVHPGEINLDEDRDRVLRLFNLINTIAEKMITEPKHIEELYASLPVSALTAVEKRDGKKNEQ